jgi:predicted MFS family arabinose efflux permease
MHTERWHFKRGLLWAAQVCVALSAFVVYLSVRPLALAAAFLLAGVGMGVTYFSSQYYGIRSPLRRARRAAIHEALIGSGYLAGAYCGGQAARAYSLRTPYAVSIFVLLALLMVQAVIDTCWRVSRKR